MKNKYQIDQSGKIEDTAKPTVIGYSDGSQRAVIVPAKVKRQLQEEFRSLGLTKLFIYHVFAVGLYFLIKDFRQKQQIVIDLEYPEKDKIIRDMLTRLSYSHGKPEHDISFSRIGNRPKAHYAAKDVFDGKKNADYKVTFAGAVRALKKADGRLRECLSTLVDARPRLMKRSYQKKGKKSR